MDEENLDIYKNEKIEEVLEEFQAENSVQIDQNKEAEQVLTVKKDFKKIEPTGMTKLVIKIFGGLVKNERQANCVLLVFTILSITVTVLLLFNDNKNMMTQEQRIQLQKMQQYQEIRNNN